MATETFAWSNVQTTIQFLLETKHTNGFLTQVQNSFTAVSSDVEEKN